MKDLKTKLTSRKFLIALAGVISGVVLLANGNTTEGVTSIVASVVAYLAAEGLVDMAAVKSTVGKAEDTQTKIEAATDEQEVNAIGFVASDDDAGGFCD